MTEKCVVSFQISLLFNKCLWLFLILLCLRKIAFYLPLFFFQLSQFFPFTEGIFNYFLFMLFLSFLGSGSFFLYCGFACGDSIFPTLFIEETVLSAPCSLGMLVKIIWLHLYIYFWGLYSTPVLYISVFIPVPYSSFIPS